MGKTMYMISIVLFVDLLFLTFWGGTTSLQSIIANWILNPTGFDINFVTLVLKSLFSTIAVGAVAAVVVALSGAKTDTVLFAGFAATALYNIGKDYLFMYQEVAKINILVATFFILPFMIMFAFIIVEWLKGRD